MIRHLLLSASCLAWLSQIAHGAWIQDVPIHYTPGQPFAFNVRLPAVTDLGAYNIDLVLESATGTAAADFLFDAAATSPSTAQYVFPSSANYFDAVNVDSALRHRITLSDFDLAGVDVVPGLNDLVARVVFQTSEQFSGELSLFVDADGLILDTPAIEATPVLGFEAIKANVAASGAITIRPVPEPSPVPLVLLALAGRCTQRRNSLQGRSLTRQAC